MAAKTAEEVLATSYERLLEFALSHPGDPDSARIPQLEAERDAARTRAQNLENVRDDLKNTQDILNRERAEYDDEIKVLKLQKAHVEQERDAATERVEELGVTLRTVTAERDGLKAQQAMNQTRFTQLQAELDKPRINPEWEDLDRFITAAVEHFDHDPEKALKNLTRAHLALQGKQPVEEESA